MKSRLALALSGALSLVAGCASDRYLANPGHRQFDAREWDKAADSFGKDAKEPSANQVLFLMDEGSSLFAAQKYKEAIDVFLKAEKLSEIKDYTSISEEVGTLVTSDNVRGYTGEDFEKVLVNVYLALSYSAIGNIEDAQVEARKINLILYRLIHEGKRNYQESPFARYFSAMLWEANGDYNDAYVDYKNTYDLDPSFPDIGRDLIATAHKMGFSDEEQEWRKKFPEEKLDKKSPYRTKAGEGELVVVFQKGSGPVKVPIRDGRGNDTSLPRYVTRYSNVSGARLKINGEDTGRFVPALDIVSTSTRFLQDRIGRMMAAKVAGAATKGALAYGLGKAAKNETLGWLAFFALMASDRADLRCWRTLPAELELARVPLKAGTYDVKLEILGFGGQVVGATDYPKLEVKAGQKQFIVGR